MIRLIGTQWRMITVISRHIPLDHLQNLEFNAKVDRSYSVIAVSNHVFAHRLHRQYLCRPSQRQIGSFDETNILIFRVCFRAVHSKIDDKRLNIRRNAHVFHSELDIAVILKVHSIRIQRAEETHGDTTDVTRFKLIAIGPFNSRKFASSSSPHKSHSCFPVIAHGTAGGSAVITEWE